MGELIRRPRAGVLGVLMLAVLIAALPAGRRPFWSSDEARVALLAQDVLDHGRWIVAQIRGQPYLNKPQLFFWSVAVASLPFGRVTELSAAIPAVVSSIAGVAGVVAVGRLLWGWPVGVVAGLILITAPMHFEMSHQVLPDVMMNAWLVWALYAFVLAERGGWRLSHLLVFYGCIAAALLCKGPEALAALAGAGLAVALTDGVRNLRRLRPALGAALVLAVAGIVWLIPYAMHPRGGFAEHVVGGHYVTWYFLGSLRSRLETVITPLPAFLPWTILLLAAPFWWRQSPDPARQRVVVWTATMWLLVTASGNYRARYLLPVLPGFALLTADVVTAPLTGLARQALRIAMLAGGALTLVVAAFVLSPLALAVAHEDRAYVPEAAWERTVIVVLMLVAGWALVRAVRYHALTSGAVGLALAVAGILIVEGLTYPIRYARWFDVRPLAAAAAADVPSGGTVVGYPDLRLSYDFYLRRRIVEVRNEAATRHLVAAEPRQAIIMTAERWRALAPFVAPGWHVLASATVRDRNMVTVGGVQR
jgi:4-amino-4-deoxy-L-arabinose transferase-like glycosyltransferase